MEASIDTFELHRLRCEYDNKVGWIWPIVLIIIFIFLIWAEDRSQCCNGKPCHNSGPEWTGDETFLEAMDKTITTVHLNDKLVHWRRAMIASFSVALLTMLIYYAMGTCAGFPSGIIIFLITFFIFLGVYSSIMWKQTRWFRPKNNRTERLLRNLRDKHNGAQVDFTVLRY